MQRRETLFALLLILPAFAFIGIIIFYPMVLSFRLSLFQVDLTRKGTGTPFVGLANYIDIFTSNYFWSSIGRTTYFTVVSIAIEMVLGLFVALLLNEKFWGRGILRSLLLLPWALPITVDAIMWKWIFNANYGAFNALLTQLGILARYQPWLTRPWSAMHCVIIADVWKVTPLVALLLLAGLQTIPRELYEAAYVDGAGWFRSFWKITIPLLKPTMTVVLVLRTLDAFRVFDIVYVMTQGGPANATKVISFLTYQEAFKFLHFSRGAALSYIITLIVALLAYLYTQTMKRQIEY
ncbi:MAG: sugar ABC transporter permease [Candidatus Caldatribacterium sp.]|uniref:carbohydrate ABC transporter permease n=1 Tax=Candidatus Caldatribacterium sp. TaxID=2282143 RepID=UPI002997A118|nr:sugar ABC transporter permease [Candidatus Caldatribacterium sp.]MCX7729634.1 sugar ABC transporter permease [Candidatus Caldatribacterium sp.]MDW8080954.1 sugar ABC transporter permease [Candidatus Calescibacterium sp.]